jgi:hypothetical protein
MKMMRQNMVAGIIQILSIKPAFGIRSVIILCPATSTMLQGLVAKVIYQLPGPKNKLVQPCRNIKLQKIAGIQLFN